MSQSHFNNVLLKKKYISNIRQNNLQCWQSAARKCPGGAWESNPLCFLALDIGWKEWVQAVEAGEQSAWDVFFPVDLFHSSQKSRKHFSLKHQDLSSDPRNPQNTCSPIAWWGHLRVSQSDDAGVNNLRSYLRQGRRWGQTLKVVPCACCGMCVPTQTHRNEHTYIYIHIHYTYTFFF